MTLPVNAPVLSADVTAALAAQAVFNQTHGIPAHSPLSLPAAEGRRHSARLNEFWNTPPTAIQRQFNRPVSGPTGSTRLVGFVPPNPDGGAIIYAHGGGFAFGSPETHRQIACGLAVAAGVTVLSVDYRLSPEHPFPAGLDDMIAAWRAANSVLAAEGLTEGPLWLAGDSAGANLAVAAMLHEKAQGHPLPAGGLLFYAMLGLDFTTPSYRTFENGPGLTKNELLHFWQWYGAPNGQEALFAPLSANDRQLADLPPLFLVAAGVDPLLSDTLILAERRRAMGCDDALHTIPAVTHGFLKMAGQLTAADATLQAAGDWLKRQRTSQ